MLVILLSTGGLSPFLVAMIITVSTRILQVLTFRHPSHVYDESGRHDFSSRFTIDNLSVELKNCYFKV